jgi:hypothetical protein
MPRRSRRAAVALLTGAVIAGGLASACADAGSSARPPRAPSATDSTASSTSTTSTAASATTAAPAGGTALGALATLPVKGRAPQTGYAREQFGPRWADVDRNGCDTRNDILNRDLAAKTWRAETHGCVVLSGALTDPYTGTPLTFTKADAAAVQIDHVVALSNAWQTGAQQLDATERRALANDPLELLAVDGPTNLRKGDGDAATWLPPDRSFRCRYAARQVAVKARYRLWTTPAEHAALARVLASCPGEPLPHG